MIEIQERKSKGTAAKENRQVAKAAGIVGSLTLVSRVLGYVRDMVTASYFGAGIYADAFIAAFRIPNLMRRLFGEGALSVAFVPVFSEYLVNGDATGAQRMAHCAIRLLSLILAIIVACGILFAPLIVKLVAPGFEVSPEKYHLTVLLTRIMFPYLLFVGLVALSTSILNGLGLFAAPALAPAFLNLAMISAIIMAAWFSQSQDFQVVALALGVLVGGGFQLVLQIPFLMKSGIFFVWRGPLFHSGLSKVARLMLPTMLGSAVYQINILVGTFLASQLPEGSISYLYYADRLVQFPLGIFAIAMGTAVLPTLSRQAAGRDFTGLAQTFSEALRLILFIMLPAMVGLVVLREPIVKMLFQRGAFDAVASQLTSDALLYYGIGLWAFSAVRVLLPTFYALQETWIPVKSGALSILANIVLGITLMKPMGHCGLALATTLASILNFVLLTLSLRYQMGALGWPRIVRSSAKSLFCAGVMGGAVWLLGRVNWGVGSDHRIFELGRLGMLIITGVGIFAATARVLRMQELKSVLGIINLKKDMKKY